MLKDYRKYLKVLFSVGLLLLLFSTLGSAQNITVNNNLAFGDVFPGVPKEITKYTAGSAAEVQISGTAGSDRPPPYPT